MLLKIIVIFYGKDVYGGVFNFGTEVTEIHKYPML